MGNILNPNKKNFFINLVQAKDFRVLVDKTDFIAETNERFDLDGNLLALTRPRRFGKTVTAHMLLAYYSKAYAGQHLFDGLKIAGNGSYAKHLNKYDVIYIDMNTIRDEYIAYTEDEDLQVKGVTTFVDYLKYTIIEDLKENEDYARVIGKSRKVGKKNLPAALQAVCEYTGERFVLIMDEWDLIFIDLLTSLFKSDGGLGCFALAYLTGILPIKKYNSQSALNTFDEYNMLAPGEFACYFGFTENEVAEIVKSAKCRISLQELKEWYEGYKIKGIDIYNPNSVVNAVRRNECISYWSGTSSNEEVIRLINMDFDGIKEDMLHLIEGEEIVFNCGRFQNDMVSIKSKDDVFCLLVCLGYLGCKNPNDNNSDTEKSEDENNKADKQDKTEKTEQNGRSEQSAAALRKNRRIAYVPNAEIKSALLDIVKEQDWYERMETIKRSEQLLKAIKALDGDETARLIQEVHNSPAVSIYDYNTESALTYCVITGLMWSTLDDYDYHREDQAGKGKVDLVYEPTVKGRDPLILIEFKYGKSAEEALKQIKKQEYFRRYTKKYTKNIILAGINYDPKSKDHQCLIEKLC